MEGLPSFLPHGDIRCVFPEVFIVTGTAALAPLVRIPRNMVVLRHHDELTLIHCVRLSPHGLAQLDKLGRVRHVVRVGFFHAQDDAFYQEHYHAQLWCLEGHTPRHNEKVNGGHLRHGDFLPFFFSPEKKIRVFVFRAAECAEACLYVEQERLLITCDAVLNIQSGGSEFFSWIGSLATLLMGFKAKATPGPGWLKANSTKWLKKNSSSLVPAAAERNLEDDFLELLGSVPFVHLISAHGDVIDDGTAHEALEDAIKKLQKTGKLRYGGEKTSSSSWRTALFLVFILIDIYILWKMM